MRSRHMRVVVVGLGVCFGKIAEIIIRNRNPGRDIGSDLIGLFFFLLGLSYHSCIPIFLLFDVLLA